MNRRKPIYLDYQATTPLDPEVRAAMLPFLDDLFGNPYSEHRIGWEAAAAVEDARLWHILKDEIESDLFELRSHTDPLRVKAVIREKQLKILRAQSLGLAVSTAAMEGIPTDAFPAFLAAEAETLHKLSNRHKVPLERRLEKSAEKYVFLREHGCV